MRTTKALLESQVAILQGKVEDLISENNASKAKSLHSIHAAEKLAQEYENDLANLNKRINKRDQYIESMLVRLQTVRTLIQVPADQYTSQSDYMPNLEFLKSQWDNDNTNTTY